jgi:hypothetical protein
MTKAFWESPAGDTLKSILTSSVEALPSEEPMFNVIHVTHAAFGPTFKSQRNIIVTKIGSDQPDAKILVQREPFTKTQVVLTILAPTPSDFVNLIDTSRNKIVSLINEVERNRIADTYKKRTDQKVNELLANDFHISLAIPDAYKIDVRQPGFVWLSQEYRDIIQGVLIYSYEYTDENTFTPGYLVRRRNEILKKYVPGEIEGSYMITEPLYPPLFYEYQLNEKYTAELRGLWRMEGGLAMGGPFVSITQLDAERNRIITVDGFVFAPAYEKREYLRQLEAIVLSLEILPGETNSE